MASISNIGHDSRSKSSCMHDETMDRLGGGRFMPPTSFQLDKVPDKAAPVAHHSHYLNHRQPERLLPLGGVSLRKGDCDW
ncbi:hypothetical protein PLEOSDRAFT_1087905 [Pleurotus ostreatus PC15]|uniref:Uncharacterized protein n=1 Tax=Pleurotus ostreatus (strain PC15) TaxID=1137138 RepID=A0A067PCN3_PLEO1|nr:hypothetical protein PLEOSDRAFT_1087905 [Pleurotus ostreatus PC15]